MATTQDEFGGAWTQQKLEALSKYLRAYTRIFAVNPRAQFYSITYVDAFAGTGSLQLSELAGFGSLLPDLEKNDEEFRKGSAARALEVEPPFDKYVFIEKSAKKCEELRKIVAGASARNVQVINDDANTAILRWCNSLNSQRERAVVFLDPFGAQVRWETIAALAKTQAVDLWVLFPYSAINRMLVRDHKPPAKWAELLDAVLGTHDWETAFYSTASVPSLFDSAETIEMVRKSVDFRNITLFISERLKAEFRAVSEPLPLYNSTGSLLFLLFFAAGNEPSARTGLKIANEIIGK